MSIESWFEDCEKKLQIEVKKIPLAESKDWEIIVSNDGKPDYIAHRSKRYHNIRFLQSFEPLRDNWIDRCLLEPVLEDSQDAYAVILLAMHENKYLVQAKGEPGNCTPYRVALTSTIQASFVNIALTLSGEIPFLDLLRQENCLKFKIIQDGGQLLNKINYICFIELEEKPKNIPSYFYWATLEEIKSFASKTLVTEHLIQTLGMQAFYK